MLHQHWLARTASVVLCVLMSVPVVAVEATAAKLNQTKTKVMDLKRQANGTILGKLVDRQGKALANASVELASKRGTVSAKTNQDGVFAAAVGTGEVAMRVAGQTQRIRVWDNQLAPPAAPSVALLVAGDAVRAQCCDTACAPACDVAPSCDACGGCDDGCDACGGCGLFGGGAGGLGGGGLFGGAGAGAGGVLSSPLLIAAGVASAIAIPIAIDDDDAS